MKNEICLREYSCWHFFVNKNEILPSLYLKSIFRFEKSSDKKIIKFHLKIILKLSCNISNLIVRENTSQLWEPPWASSKRLAESCDLIILPEPGLARTLSLEEDKPSPGCNGTTWMTLCSQGEWTLCSNKMNVTTHNGTNSKCFSLIFSFSSKMSFVMIQDIQL